MKEKDIKTNKLVYDVTMVNGQTLTVDKFGYDLIIECMKENIKFAFFEKSKISINIHHITTIEPVK